jgi:hypothetical protein
LRPAPTKIFTPSSPPPSRVPRAGPDAARGPLAPAAAGLGRRRDRRDLVLVPADPDSAVGSASFTAAAATSSASNSSASDSTITRYGSSPPASRRLAQRRARQLEALRAEVGDRGDAADLDLLLRRALDVLELPVLARLRERDGDALAPRAARPPDAVHVDVRGRRDVVVDDVREVADVEAAGGDVCRDDELQRAGAQLLHHAVALRLRDAAVQSLDAQAAALQRLGEVVDLDARPAENERRGRRLEVQHAPERRPLVAARDDVRGLAHLRELAGSRRLARDRDPDGSFRCRVAMPMMRGGQRRGEERGLTVRRRDREDRLEVLGEPMSSISSASSSTSVRMPSMRSVLRLTWSSARPGVATTTSTPRFNARSCVSIDAPP